MAGPVKISNAVSIIQQVVGPSLVFVDALEDPPAAVDGTVIPESEIYVTANTGGRAENVVCHTIADLSTGQYIEIFVENESDTDDAVVTDLSVIIEALN